MKYQVVIVGGGPVGVALAVDLGLRGISCALIERHLMPQKIPKGQNLMQRSVEHFWRWGIVDELRAARAMPTDYPMSGIIAYGDLTTVDWYAPPLREIVNSYYFQDNERLPQYRTEAVLRAKMATLPTVDARFGWSMTDLTQDNDGVRITIAEVDGPGRDVVEAEYAVGCDGSHSRVRDQIGIPRSGADFDQLMVLAVFRSQDLNEGLKRFPERSTYRVMHRDLDGYWQFFGRIDVEEGWFFHAPVPKDTTRDNYDFHGLLQRVAGFDFGVEFDYVGFWDLRIDVAEQYRVGRVFIAGDAAHSHPPYGGYGLNNGLEDAVNLGWKLAAVFDGWGGDGLLGSYGAERHPVFRDTATDFIAGRIEADRDFFATYDPESDPVEFSRAWQEDHAGMSAPRVLGYEPHYEGSPIVAGAPGAESGAHGEHSFDARTGHHLPPQELSSGRNVFEALVDGFTLFAFDVPDAVVTDFETIAASAGLPLTIVRDTYADGRTEFGARLILVRPDQYIAWCGDTSPPDIAGLLARCAGH
jgi:2-polyprenyl-6-methoxyphenol hydroxylase-like FAD-dependent oxidoreductase